MYFIYVNLFGVFTVMAICFVFLIYLGTRKKFQWIPVPVKVLLLAAQFAAQIIVMVGVAPISMHYSFLEDADSQHPAFVALQKAAEQKDHAAFKRAYLQSKLASEEQVIALKVVSHLIAPDSDLYNQVIMLARQKLILKNDYQEALESIEAADLSKLLIDGSTLKAVLAEMLKEHSGKEIALGGGGF